MSIETVLTERARSIGAHTVGRVLPQIARRAVGPFVFLDHMGPVDVPPGRSFDIGPHPHIGLSTLSYLFEGALVHRDSLGTHQVLEPGGVNFMTAGRGIVHSERGTEAQHERGGRLHGLQFWVALPLHLEACEPSFQHVSARDLPSSALAGVQVSVVAGSVQGITSPLTTHAPFFLAVATLPEGAVLSLPDEHEERAAYVIEGSLEVEGSLHERGRLLVFGSGPALVRASAPTHVAIFGGPRLDAPRLLDWNFVSSSRDELERAKADWRDQTSRFAKIPGDDHDFIPLPGR